MDPVSPVETPVSRVFLVDGTKRWCFPLLPGDGTVCPVEEGPPVDLETHGKRGFESTSGFGVSPSVPLPGRPTVY